MKKLYVSFMALTLILSSCGGPLSITKRHYNSGFYVEKSGGSNHGTQAESGLKAAKSVAQKQEPQPLTTAAVAKSEQPESPVNNTVTASSAGRQLAGSPKHIVSNQTSVALPVMPLAKVEKEKSVSNIFVHNNKSNSSDDRTILLLILCILLPPLAVFLKDNAIGLNFWIDLILTLLFWVPGIIFALIVCFLM